MRFIRYKKDKPEYRGILDGEKIRRINGTIFHDYSLSDDVENINDIEILPPVLPNKIIGIRANYGRKEEGLINPKIFLKPASTVIAHNKDIVIPKDTPKVCVEAEIALIIGKKCKNVSESSAEHYILGYTIGNDITGVYESADMNVTLGKSYDTFTPLGTFINTDIDYNNLNIKAYKNGKIIQDGNSRDMIFKIPFLVSYLSSIMTLLPGDIILTGTPAPAVEIKAGDIIDIEIEGLGRLSNKVVNE